MATYIDLQRQVLAQAEFRERVAVAVLDIAEDYITAHAVSTAGELKWAVRLIAKPPDLIDKIINQLVMKNSLLTVEQIIGVLDADLKTGTKAAIVALIQAENKAST